jgi:hypothetical protein
MQNWFIFLYARCEHTNLENELLFTNEPSFSHKAGYNFCMNHMLHMSGWLFCFVFGGS